MLLKNSTAMIAGMCLASADILEKAFPQQVRRRPVIGPLRIHPHNPRYFAGDGGKIVYLTGFQFWDSLRHDGTPNPEALNFDQFLDIVERYNTNFVRLWRWNELSKYRYSRDGNTFYTSLSPWKRTGPGMALDGKPRFDLNRFNSAYFDLLRSRVMAARDRGIYVSVMLFEGHSLQFSDLPWRWDGHPFNRHNNINGINGDPNNDGMGIETHTLHIPAVTAIQEAYVRKVIDTLNNLDNVLYEVCNESGVYSTEWQYHIIHIIKRYEAGKPKQHPVGMSFQGGSNRALLDGPADWIAPGPEEDYRNNPPAADGRKVILSDTDHLGGTPGDHVWVWKSFLRGLNPINYMELPQLLDKLPYLKSARKAMGHTRMIANRVHLAQMAPHNELASSAYCLAQPGVEYLIYNPEAGEITVDLSQSRGTFAIDWIHPADGTLTSGGVISGGARRTFTAPFRGDAVLYIYKVKRSGSDEQARSEAS